MPGRRNATGTPRTLVYEHWCRREPATTATNQQTDGENISKEHLRPEGTPPVSRGRHVLDVGEPPAAARRELVLEAGDV